MSDIFSNDRLIGRFFQILAESNPQDRMYIYQIVKERVIKPAVYKGEPIGKFDHLLFF